MLRRHAYEPTKNKEQSDRNCQSEDLIPLRVVREDKPSIVVITIFLGGTQ